MYRLFDIKPCGFNDLYVHECGYHVYDDNLFNALGYKNNFGAHLIHFVIRGNGKILQLASGQKIREYEASAGEIFYIPPEDVYEYNPNMENPWYYYWIALKGSHAKAYVESIGFLTNPVLSVANAGDLEQRFLELLETADDSASFGFAMAAKMYNLLTTMAEGVKREEPVDMKQERLSRAVAYISLYKNRKVSIDQVAATIGIDRSYLYTLFMNHFGMSPSAYIAKIKIDYACALFMDGKTRSIKEVAYLTGFNDPQYFSRFFHKETGMSPSVWKARQ